MSKKCNRCHKCGGPINLVLDGEEWCPNCERYQRPISHGWTPLFADQWDKTPCKEGS